MLFLGAGLIVISMFYPSSSLAILGMVLVSLGAIFLYVTPVKHVPLTLLNSSAEVAVANIERLISELNLTESGIYLPPKNLKKEPSLVFIPETIKTLSSTSEETNGKLLTGEKTGAFVTPPGAALSRLFEQKMGISFPKTDINKIQNKLQKLLVEDMELAESAEIQIQESTITIEIVGSVLDEICRQTDSQPKTHKRVGCLLSSAIACTLAKATGKPVTILNETRNKETETTIIEYQIFEEKTMQLKSVQFTPLICSDARLSDRDVKSVTTQLKSVQFTPLICSDAGISDREDKRSVSENDDLGSLEIEIAPNAIDYFTKNGDVFILTDHKNPQYSYFKIKGYDFDPEVNLLIKFIEFVEICKTCPNSQNNINSSRTEFTTKTFGVSLQEETTHHNLAYYVAKSGFSTIDDWIKALKAVDDIPGCLIGKKIFYLYHIQAISAFALQHGPAQIFKG
jgi:hypothetical protein